MEAKFQALATETGTEFRGFLPGTSCWIFDAEPSLVSRLLEILYRREDFWCDYLCSITAEHIPGTPAMIRLHYHLESLTKGLKIQVRSAYVLEQAESKACFPSVHALWHAAGWHEREAAELFGIEFEGHPDLRKLLLPSDWEGFPLRKDYQPGESYHGLKIRYEKS
jgi:NADH-quinone oxidoreductase subunit C